MTRSAVQHAMQRSRMEHTAWTLILREYFTKHGGTPVNIHGAACANLPRTVCQQHVQQRGRGYSKRASPDGAELAYLPGPRAPETRRAESRARSASPRHGGCVSYEQPCANPPSSEIDWGLRSDVFPGTAGKQSISQNCLKGLMLHSTCLRRSQSNYTLLQKARRPARPGGSPAGGPCR